MTCLHRRRRTRTVRAEQRFRRGVEALLYDVKLVVPADEGGLEDGRALRSGARRDHAGRLEELYGARTCP